MTEKELTEIKTHVINGDWFGKVFQHEWLKVIELAERAQALESELEDASKVVYSMDKALEFYSGMTSDVAMSNLAERIKKTLEGRM